MSKRNKWSPVSGDPLKSFRRWAALWIGRIEGTASDADSVEEARLWVLLTPAERRRALELIDSRPPVERLHTAAARDWCITSSHYEVEVLGTSGWFQYGTRKFVEEKQALHELRRLRRGAAAQFRLVFVSVSRDLVAEVKRV